MKTFISNDFEPEDANENLWVYNGLDCCLTLEIYNKLLPLFNENTKKIYRWEFASQSLAFEMMVRGILVDRNKVRERLAEVKEEYERTKANFWELTDCLGFPELNPNSPKQLQEFFYGETFGIKPIMYRGKITTDRKAMEKIKETTPRVGLFAKFVLYLHDLGKIISVLETEIDPDSRMRASYSVAGTETGRWNSSMNCFGSGTNMQNITNALRDIFVAEPGYKFAYCDLQAAESKGVGYISDDAEYIKLCDYGDAHTAVARLVWKDLPWTGEIEKDRAIADNTLFYRDNGVRDMAKRGGHGTNYLGTPRTMAMHLKMPVDVVEDFQMMYFHTFPGIKQWHENVIYQIQTERKLTTVFGRERIFFGHPNDTSTWREAVAFEPQSTIADTLNLGAYRVQRRWNGGDVQIMAQLHDAILIKYREEMEEELLPQVLALMTISTKMKSGKVMTIGVDCEVGWNWSKFDKKNPLKNPDGLKKWKGKDERIRKDKPCVSVQDWKLNR